MNVLRWFLVALAFGILLVLALYNTEPVTLRLLNLASVDSPLVFVVFTAFAAGVGCGLLAGAMRSSRLKRQLQALRRDSRGSGRDPAPHGAVPEAAAAKGQGSVQAARRTPTADQR